MLFILTQGSLFSSPHSLLSSNKFPTFLCEFTLKAQLSTNHIPQVISSLRFFPLRQYVFLVVILMLLIIFIPTNQ